MLTRARYLRPQLSLHNYPGRSHRKATRQHFPHQHQQTQTQTLHRQDSHHKLSPKCPPWNPQRWQRSKRATFGNFKFPRSGAPSRNGSVDYHQSHPRRNTVVRRPSSSAATYARHRPSMSSFGSTGTNRSFPLVDKSKGTNGILTPTGTPGGSPDSELRQISESLLNEAAGLGGIEGGQKNGNTSAVQGLDKESQILVERLVASLGKCVLGLTESSRAGTEARMYRRRIDAARRILEGLEE